MRESLYVGLSEIRESNPPHRLGKPVHYRCANLADKLNFWREMQARLAEEKRATSGTRTRDPRITNALLYQLSHHGFSLYVNAKVTKIF